MRDFWFNLDDKLRFLLIGSFNAGVSYVIYSLLCLLLGTQSYQISLALAWVITSFISFFTQRTFVFQGKGIWYKEYLKCCTTWVVSYLINACLLEFTVKYLGINVFLAQLISNFSAAIFTYIVFKLVVFRKN